MKRAYSVYQKMKRQKIGLDQVYDLLALRIITDSVKNCYAALGVIHNEWHPIPGRIKDFIAIPRPNLYQSLHTSVIGAGRARLEVQIRTEEMHRLAEEGIAAHWKYKEGRKGPGVDDQRIIWLRQLVEWQKELHDPGEFMSTLKVDLYPEEVYAFTPMGKVIVLPRDATPIDFAYAIHSDVGNTCVGAKVNGRIVPLKYNLKNGDVVEILTQAGHLPSKDWLAIVKTSKARNKIKHVINTTERAKAIEIGQKYLEREARRLDVQLARITKADLERVAGEYGCRKMEDLHAALGYGKFSARQVLQKLLPEQLEVPWKRPSRPRARAAARQLGRSGDLVIKVKGFDDLLVYRAKCCNPIRGEAIVGYVTRGKGIAVHSGNTFRRCLGNGPLGHASVFFFFVASLQHIAREMPEHPQRQPIERLRVRGRIGVLNHQALDQRLGLRRGHADTQARCLSGGISRHHHAPLSVSAHQNQRRLRRRRCIARLPPDPVGGQGRQEDGDDPCHRTPPVRNLRSRQRGSGSARPASAVGRRRGPEAALKVAPIRASGSWPLSAGRNRSPRSGGASDVVRCR